MNANLLKLLQQLTIEELKTVREDIDRLIKQKYHKTLGDRGSKRVSMNLAASCDVEREKEFFDREHRITILDMSVDGLRFKCGEALVENDLLGIYFRSPSNGVEKKIDCRVIRVTEVKTGSSVEYHIAARGVGKDYVRKYKDWLSKRSLYLGA